MGQGRGSRSKAGKQDGGKGTIRRIQKDLGLGLSITIDRFMVFRLDGWDQRWQTN